MKNIVNSTQPTSSVKNTIPSNKNSNVFINFTTFPNWTHSIRVKNYTNQLKNEKECSKSFYKLVNKLFPFLQTEGTNLFTGLKHCHLIKDQKRELAVGIIKEIHGIDLSTEVELWQLAYGEGTRLVSALVSGKDEDGTVVVYPLFIDHHHLIYPSKNHNQKDLSEKSCRFCPQKQYT